MLGLNYKEREEFIIYWLPKLKAHDFNHILFDSKEVQDEYMGLNIVPKPDTLIRIHMSFKGLDEDVDIPEQKLTKQHREGFTVVE